MKVPVKVAVGGFDLLVSGTTVSFGYQTVDIYPVDPTFSVRIVYRTVPNVPATIVVDQSIRNQAQLIATNIDQPTGSAAGAPIHIANWNGKKCISHFPVTCWEARRLARD